MISADFGEKINFQKFFDGGGCGVGLIRQIGPIGRIGGWCLPGGGW
jgi:hypothetical protein